MVERRYYRPDIERMPREAFLAFQWKLIKEQMEYAYAHSGLCQRKFREAKITPDDIKTREDFSNRVPFTTKQELIADQQENPPYGSRLSIPKSDIWITYLTSGTSGRGQEVHTGTREDWQNYFTGLHLIYTWIGWKKGDKVMNSLPYTTAAGGFGHTLGMLEYGLDVFNLGSFDTKTRLDYMKRFQLTGIFIGPAYLQTVTNEIEKMGLNPAKDFCVKTMMTAGQAYPLSFMQKMEAKWNAKIYDYYGSTQFALGSTCENGAVNGNKRGFYHLFQHRAFHEIINPETLRPVAPGEEGEVVVTPLKKKGSPIIRFRQSDKGRFFPHNACDCGRPFDLLEAGTIARYDDMMKIKGMNVWPETVDEIVLTKDEAAEYKGRVFISDEGKEKVELVIEFHPGTNREVKQKLMSRVENEIRDKVGVTFIIIEATQELPRYLTKATSRRWTDERVKGLDKRGVDRV